MFPLNKISESCLLFACCLGGTCVLWPGAVCGWGRRWKFHHIHHVSMEQTALAACCKSQSVTHFPGDNTVPVVHLCFCMLLMSFAVDRATTLSPTRPSTPRPLPPPLPPTMRLHPALSQTSLDLWPRSQFLWQQEEPIAGQLLRVQQAMSFREVMF